jgi:hypothetical protein
MPEKKYQVPALIHFKTSVMVMLKIPGMPIMPDKKYQVPVRIHFKISVMVMLKTLGILIIGVKKRRVYHLIHFLEINSDDDLTINKTNFYQLI